MLSPERLCCGVALEAEGVSQGRPDEARHRGRSQVKAESEAVGLLVSGGLDSCIMLQHLLDVGREVKPFYVRSGLYWQEAELAALERCLDALATRCLQPLTLFDLPLVDLYRDHWSMTGQSTPGSDTPDDAVFLPGRNILLMVKAALWCQMHDIDQLAVATLRSNPFDDASRAALDKLEEAFGAMWSRSIRIVRPFGELDKKQVMEIGRDFPLELTFSCIAPRDGVHCGRCNKCAERQTAFGLIDIVDPTLYASSPVATTRT